VSSSLLSFCLVSYNTPAPQARFRCGWWGCFELCLLFLILLLFSSLLSSPSFVFLQGQNQAFFGEDAQRELAALINNNKNEKNPEKKKENEKKIEEKKEEKKQKRGKNSRGGKKIAGPKKAAGPSQKKKKDRMKDTQTGEDVEVVCSGCPTTKMVNEYKENKLITPNHVKKVNGKSVHCGVFRPTNPAVITVTKKVLK
jgi:hypothetical protein